MQENDQSRRAGRPSLLSEQTPAAASPSILSKLDGGAPKAKAGDGARAVARVAGIAAAVALTGGAVGWAMSVAEVSEPAPVVASSVAPKPQLAATAAPAVAPAAAAAGAAVLVQAGNAHGQDASIATILDETPGKPDGDAKSLAAALEAPQAPRAADKPAAAAGKDELLDMLDKPEAAALAAKAASASAPAKDVVPKAEKRSEDSVKLASAEKKKRKEQAAKDKAASRQKARTVASAKTKPETKAKAKPPVDTDVAVLTALLTHSKKTSAAARKKTSTEFKKCAELGGAAAEKCREQVCESGAKNAAECKPPHVANAAS